MTSKVRELDLFAVPVSLTYKGNERFGTLCGGCLSLFIILVFTTYAVVALWEQNFNPALHNPLIKGNTNANYFAYEANTKRYDIATKSATIAVQIQRE